MRPIVDAKHLALDYAKHHVLVDVADHVQMLVHKHVLLGALVNVQHHVDQMVVLDPVHKTVLAVVQMVARDVAEAVAIIAVVIVTEHVVEVAAVVVKVIVTLLVHGAVDQMDVLDHALDADVKAVAAEPAKKHVVKIALVSALIILDTREVIIYD